MFSCCSIFSEEWLFASGQLHDVHQPNESNGSGIYVQQCLISFFSCLFFLVVLVSVHALFPSQHNASGLQGMLCKMKGRENLFLNLGQLSDLVRTH